MQWKYPRYIQAIAQPLQLRASLNNQPSPISLGLGRSDRTFGVGLISVSINYGLNNAKRSFTSTQAILENYRHAKNYLASLSGLLISGWNPSKDESVWSNSQAASISLPARSSTDSLLLKCRLRWLGDECPLRKITVDGNNIDWTLVEDGDKRGQLSAIIGEGNTLVFVASKAVSLFDMGISNDERLLTFQIQNFNLVKIPELSEYHLDAAWHEPESDGVWTSRKKSRLVWHGYSDEDRVGKKQGIIRLSHIAEHPQIIEIIINNNQIIKKEVAPNIVKEISFMLESTENSVTARKTLLCMHMYRYANLPVKTWYFGRFARVGSVLTFYLQRSSPK